MVDTATIFTIWESFRCGDVEMRVGRVMEPLPECASLERDHIPRFDSESGDGERISEMFFIPPVFVFVARPSLPSEKGAAYVGHVRNVGVRDFPGVELFQVVRDPCRIVRNIEKECPFGGEHPVNVPECVEGLFVGEMFDECESEDFCDRIVGEGEKPGGTDMFDVVERVEVIVGVTDGGAMPCPQFEPHR